MLVDCFDLGWDAFFHKYPELQEKAVAALDFAEAMEACRAGRDPQWGQEVRVVRGHGRMPVRWSECSERIGRCLEPRN